MRQDAVDIHAHYIPSPLIDAIRSGGAVHSIEVVESARGSVVSFGGLSSTQALPPGMLDLDHRIAWMDERGIGLQVLSCWIDFSAYELDAAAGAWLASSLNDLTAETIATHSSRFRAMATVPLQTPLAAAQELRRATGELGMVGVEIASSVGDKELDDPSLDPFWAAADELGVVVFVHPHHPLGQRRMDRYFLSNAVGTPAEEALVAAYLSFGGVLERHPGLTVLLTHGGGFHPYQVGRQDRAFHAKPELAAGRASQPPSAFLGRFLYDSITHSPEALRFLVERVGPERVVLGSDYPFPMGDPDPCATLDAAHLDSRSAQAIRNDNAVRAFGL